MSTAKNIYPSAPLLEQEGLAMANAPPSYEEAVGGARGYLPVHVPSPVPPAGPPLQPHALIIGPVSLGPKPAKISCPVCHNNIKTSTTTENQTGAHVACLLMCLLGFCLCSCVPYCMDSCKKVRHLCPNCKSYLGTYTG
uniref:LITAF domain-containing protein n=1 Tax=Timema cristinae TaxID=61476 RepID=A0A7R9H399_TIMCR|nr:unnamed protein product [Timema cristinae]